MNDNLEGCDFSYEAALLTGQPCFLIICIVYVSVKSVIFGVVTFC